jgi:uncharacterized protein involved in exopolysaccharide biosynthesis
MPQQTSTQNMNSEAESLLSLRDLVRVMFKHGRPFLIIIALSLVGSAGYVFLVSPTYTASSKILVKIGREKFSALENTGEQATRSVMFNERPQNVNNEIEILTDPTLMDTVFPQLKEEALKVYPRPKPETLLQYLKYYAKTAWAGIKDAAKAVGKFVKEPFYQLGLLQRLSPDDALKAQFLQALQVKFIKETDLIDVRFHWNNPFFASYAVNTYVNAYKRRHITVNNAGMAPLDFYEEKARASAAKLTEIKDRTKAFLGKAGMSDLSARETEVGLTYISNLERDLSEKNIRRRNLDDRLRALRTAYTKTDKWIVTPADKAEDATMNGLDSRYVELRDLLRDARNRFKPASQEVRNLNQQIQEVRTEKYHVLRSYYQMQLAAVREEASSMGAELKAKQSRLSNMRDFSLTYRLMLDERDAAERQLNEYRQKIQELSVNAGLNKLDVASVRVLSEAKPPVLPSAPRKTLILGLALGFSILIGIAYIVISEFFDHTFSSHRDVNRVLGLPLLAKVPELQPSSRES